jgi:outer membrane protease
MLRALIFLLSATTICLSAVAQEEDSIAIPKPKKFSIAVSVNRTTEDLTWSIAGNIQGTSPNIYSELIWKDLQGTPIRLDAQWNFWKSFLIRARVSRMSITSGTVRDTDYQEDNRTLPVFDVTVESNMGTINSFVAEAGYQILKGERIKLNVFAGYTSTRQQLYLLDTQGKFDKRLRSTYEPSWTGFCGTLSANLALSKVIHVAPQVTYHQVNYNSVADWNLIDSFRHPDSFKHKAKGFGIEGSLQLQFHLHEGVALFLEGNYSEWSTGKGTDTLYLADGQVQRTQLNEAVRKSLGIGVGMLVSF